MSHYLFDIGGDVIAFRRSWDDAFVFDLDGRCIGWQPWNGRDVVDLDGQYLGSIVGDRLVRRNDCCGRACDEDAPHPGEARPTGRPAEPLEFAHPFAYDDVALDRAG